MAKPQVPEMEYDAFNAPVPGQSLTDAPGGNAWERPPRYTKVGEVADVLMKKIFQKENVRQTLIMLDSGLSVEAVAKTILFAGFSEGQFTPDVAILVGRLVFEAVLTIGIIGEIKNLKITIKPQDREKNDFEFEMGQLKFAKSIAERTKSNGKKDIKEKNKEANMGLMTRPTMEGTK